MRRLEKTHCSSKKLVSSRGNEMHREPPGIRAIVIVALMVIVLVLLNIVITGP